MSTVHDDHSPRKSSNGSSRSNARIKRSFEVGGISIPFFPELAKAMGNHSNKELMSLIIQQIDYWMWNRSLEVNDWIEDFDGLRAVNLSAEDIRRLGLDHVDRRSINRAVKNLLEEGLLMRGRPEDFPGPKRWLAINYEELETRGVIIHIDEMVNSTNVRDTSSHDDLENWDTSSHSTDVRDTSSQELGRNVPGRLIYRSESLESVGKAQMGEGEESVSGNPPEDPLKVQNSLTGNEDFDQLAAALARVVGMDLQIKNHRRQLLQTVDELWQAGYVAEDLEEFPIWWRERDWRGKKGDTPRPLEVLQTIAQARAWNDQHRMAPPIAEQQRLKAEANSDCLECGGKGWIVSHDPREPWFYCDRCMLGMK